MADIIFNWTDKNFGETEHRVYRSDTPMDTQSMPAPLAVLGANVEAYTDDTAVAGETYYYILSAIVNGVEYFTDEMEVDTAQQVEIPLTGLVARYTMDSVVGSTVIDEQGNHDGTLYNNSSTAAGLKGQALDLPGGGVDVGGYMDTGIATPFNSDSITFVIPLYMRPTNDPDQDYQFIFGSRSSTSRYYLIRQDNSIGLGLGGSGANGTEVPLPNEQWAVLFWVQSGNTVSVYVNDATSPLLQKTTSYGSINENLFVGAMNYDSPTLAGRGRQPVNALIDETLYYTRPLPHADRQQITAYFGL